MEEVQSLTQLDGQPWTEFAKQHQCTSGLIRSNPDEPGKPIPSDRRSSNGSQDGARRLEPQIIVDQGLQNFIARFIYYQAKHWINGSFPISDRRTKKAGACLPDLVSDRERWQAMNGYLVQDFSGRRRPPRILRNLRTLAANA